jgi:ribosomal protein S27E
VCSGIECPSSIEEATRTLCANATTDYMPPSSIVRREGCGRIYLTSSNGFAGQGWLYALSASSDAGDTASASLVGSMSFVDVDTEPCATYSWFAGESFDCEEVVACQVCGVTLGDPLPACD